MDLPRTAVAVQNYRRAYDVSLIGLAGDILTPLRWDAEYPGWVWCADTQGIEAWVPESWLVVSGGRAVLKNDYNSNELDLQIGDRLVLLIEENGWYCALRAGGELGWVPADSVESNKPG